ncbi:MAG: hypothetical protein ACKVS9_17375 [Phycisphaerae bacterium]
MKSAFRRRLTATILAASLGTTLQLDGCNATLRSTTEDGIISGSQSLLTALFQALIGVAGEDADGN